MSGRPIAWKSSKQPAKAELIELIEAVTLQTEWRALTRKSAASFPRLSTAIALKLFDWSMAHGTPQGESGSSQMEAGCRLLGALL